MKNSLSVSCRALALALLILLAGAGFAIASDPKPAAGAGAPGDGNGPPPVNTNTHPDALLLNAKNPLAVHAGPGKPNVGVIYIPPSLSGKDKKGGKAGQTEQQVMGATPAH